jgi:GxxExxY protein
MCEENRIAKDVVDAALKLHKHFGAGVYENVYETTLTYQLKKRGFSPRNQIPVISNRFISSNSLRTSV